MSPGPISRRGVMAGAGVTLATVALPADIVEAVAGTPPAADPVVPSLVFDPAAFIDDLLSTGHRVALHQPVRVTGEPDEDLIPYFWIYPEPGGGFNRAYCEVMSRWADRLDTTPDHVEQVVLYILGKHEAAS